MRLDQFVIDTGYQHAGASRLAPHPHVGCIMNGQIIVARAELLVINP